MCLCHNRAVCYQFVSEWLNRCSELNKVLEISGILLILRKLRRVSSASLGDICSGQDTGKQCFYVTNVLLSIVTIIRCMWCLFNTCYIVQNVPSCLFSRFVWCQGTIYWLVVCVFFYYSVLLSCMGNHWYICISSYMGNHWYIRISGCMGNHWYIRICKLYG